MNVLFRGAVVLGSELLTRTTTIDTLVDVSPVLGCAAFVTKYFTCTALTNTLSVKILGSQDGGLTYPTTVEAEFPVTTGSAVLKTVSAFYTHLKVQVRPNVAGQHGTLTVYVKAASY